MALIALQLYSATYLQSVYRGWKAKKILKQLFLKRFLRIFLTFRFKFKKIRKSQIQIARSFRQCLLKRRLYSLIQRCVATIRIQRKFRVWFLCRRAVIRRTSMSVWKHVELFGIVRAQRVLQPLLRHRYVLRNILAQHLRRKRLSRSPYPDFSLSLSHSVSLCPQFGK
jgi:heme exporter protein D